MKDAHYNLVKLLLSKLNDTWRIEKHYASDAASHGCERCQALLTKILEQDRLQAELLRAELAQHIDHNTLA